MIVSAVQEDLLVAPNLGSCLGVAIYDWERKLGGMIHCLLPFSKADPEKARQNPCIYVDTGVAKLLESFFSTGSDRRRVTITVAGGSAINDVNGVFDIGNRNFTVLRKLLWKNNLLLAAEDVGGDCSRTVSLSIASGEVWVRKNGEATLLAPGHGRQG